MSMTGCMIKMKSIREMEIELFKESYRLRQAGFEVTKNNKTSRKYYNRCREIQEKQGEIYKKHQFFKKFLEEMEKKNDRENHK